ncbi:helix-turn-helix domain-containing protein [Polynucleobacter paneuropaeus]|nr:helix-turn-helix domain-containing protein [Polynucleobacter paneuropaeus]
MTATEARSSAKAVGKFLRKAREAKHANIYSISGLCGLSVDTIARLEVGDLSKFHQNPDEAFHNLTSYARALGVELSMDSQSISDQSYLESIPKKTLAQIQDDAQPFIPAFLRKRN